MASLIAIASTVTQVVADTESCSWAVANSG